MNSENKKTELEKKEILRLSNEESNKLTKECLQTALIQLMNEKPFDKISITELVKRSGVSRSAFYRNYDSKEDILLEINQTISQLLMDAFSQPRYLEDPFTLYKDLFTVIKENEQNFRLFLQANLQNISPLLKLLYQETDTSLSQKQFYQNIAYKGAFTQILYEWFQRGMVDDIEDMAQLCVSIFSNMYSCS